jgi:hypothetical protein
MCAVFGNIPQNAQHGRKSATWRQGTCIHQQNQGFVVHCPVRQGSLAKDRIFGLGAGVSVNGMLSF